MAYHQYLAEDFAADDRFKEWVHAPTPENIRFWHNFLHEHPDRFDYVEEGRRLVQGLQSIHSAESEESNFAALFSTRDIWTRIEASLSDLESPEGRKINWNISLKIAASLALLLSMGWLGWRYLPTNTITSDPNPVLVVNKWNESVNSASVIMDIQLADGTRVKLGKNSHLKYPQKFEGNERIVYLTGEAFFDVAKNRHLPFLVYAGNTVTKVLGTSFEIEAFADSPDVTVSVKTGRVSVYADATDHPHNDPEASGIVLTPNQKAIFKRSDATIHKAVVAKPQLVIPTIDKSLFVFEDMPAAQVFEAIRKAYGIEVIYSEAAFGQCRLTLNLTDEDMYQKLEVICKVVNAHYKLVDGQVIVYGTGC
ncbi:FecR family protein [Persicitalea jodogahamensis]|uniref:FecR family protein n=1 Tax=Persicitalea jodogahamensis TaxID=402147 RepID=A0A8J3GAZ8_9BACT|nr:FecR family protein [Persicitalea jodogahamensis]GHB78118.1 hypothetical protein GCM10007390_35420 [Persicitalea jodogahamensis]